MKGFLGCCYQRDVPPETIQNLRICLSDKSVVFAHGFIYLLDVQLQLEKFFCFFFRVGPPSWALGFKRVGPPSTLKLASCQENYFYFYLVSGIRWDIYGR